MDGKSPYEPLARWGHTSVALGDKVYIWGGRTDDFSEAAKKVLSSRVEIFDISSERWEKKKTKGNPPLGLYNNAFTVIGSDLYVFGGWDGQETHNSLHKFNSQTLTWGEMKSIDDGDVPMKMSGCGLVARGSDELVLFGGYGVPSVSGTPKTKKKENNIHLKTTELLSLSSSLNDSVKMRTMKNERVLVGRGTGRGLGVSGGRRVARGNLSRSSSREGVIEEKKRKKSRDELGESGGGRVSKASRRESRCSSREGVIEEEGKRKSKDERGGGEKEIEVALFSKGGENHKMQVLSDVSSHESVCSSSVSANSGMLTNGELLSRIDKSPNLSELTREDKLYGNFSNGDANLSQMSLHDQDMTGVEQKSNAGTDTATKEKMVNGEGVLEQEKVHLTLATEAEIVPFMLNGEGKKVGKTLTTEAEAEIMPVMLNGEEKKVGKTLTTEAEIMPVMLNGEEKKVVKTLTTEAEIMPVMLNGEEKKVVKTLTTEAEIMPVMLNGEEKKVVKTLTTEAEIMPVMLNEEEKKVVKTLTTEAEIMPVMLNGEEKKVVKTLATVGEVLSVMVNGEQKKLEDKTLIINKRWTNELNVYNIKTGMWSSPKMEGECPPPCVDFSFNSIDNGRRAVMFGGYRPESGASSGAYILDMETWFWTEIGNQLTSSGGKMLWPMGRDGHASCVVPGVPRPYLLVSGGWDQDNKLINDAWILDIESIIWKKLVVPELLGPRLWHRVVCHKSSSNIWDLIFFGGCPNIPPDVSEARGHSWDKLASTVLLELGLLKSSSSSVHLKRSLNASGKSEWVILDALGMGQMGMWNQRTKEAILFAKYRAIHAEVRAKKAEKLANEILKKLNEVLSRLEGAPCSLSVLTPSPNRLEHGSVTPEIGKPLWIIPRSEVQLTLEEVGRGRWAAIQVADYKRQRVAARCIYSRIVSENNRKLFQDNLHVLSQIRHPNILAFIGAVVDGDPIILTELLPTNLRKVLDLGKLENFQISGIAVDIAGALYFLHSIKPEPVIHGDLTSTSILLQKRHGEFWKAKISDFMTAKFFQKVISTEMDLDHDFSPTFSPTSKFPPSQATTFHSHSNPQKSLGEFALVKQTRKISQSSRKASTSVSDTQDESILTLQRDVYSFGLLLVEMCTGIPPLDVSLNFLVESITWSNIVTAVKAYTECNPDLRPSMESVLKQLKNIHEETVTIPSKFSIAKNIV